MSKLRSLTCDRRYWELLIVLTVIYYIAGKFGLSLAFENISASPVWPPTGIAIATLLMFGPKMWPAILVGAFLVNITTQGSVPVVLGISIGNTLEALVGGYLIHRFAGGRHAFNRPQDVMAFVLMGSIASALSATIGVLSLTLGGLAELRDFSQVWLTWWTGDAVGCITFGSLLVLLEQPPHFRWTARRLLEAVLLLQSLAIVGVLVFSDLLIKQSSEYPLEFLCLPFVIWAAFRFAQRGAVAATLFFSGIAIWGTLNGYGPFALGSDNESLLVLQVFIGIITVTGMALAAALTEIRKAHASLEQSFFRSDTSLKLLVESVHEVAIFLVGPSGKVMSWNKGAEHINGYTASEIIGNDFSVFYTPEDRKAGKPARLLGIAEKEGHVNDEGLRIRKDKSRYWADVIITALRDTDGKFIGYAKVIRDVTSRREAELSRSAFVGAASHELRTPLSAIRWNLELLNDDQNLSEAQSTELIGEALKQAGYMSEILQILLTLSLIEEGKMPVQNKPVTVLSVLEQIEKIHKVSLAQAQVTLTLQCPPRFTVVTDANIIKEVLSNFISNAVKYTLPGGSITVRVEQQTSDMLFTVTDTGIGVSAEEKSRIFDRFFRASNARKFSPEGGSGLGLYLCKALVRYIGGTIGFESAENKGSTFWFTVPVMPR